MDAIKRALLVAVALVMTASMTVALLGPSVFQVPSLGTIRTFPGLPVPPTSGQGIYGHVSIGPVSPLCSTTTSIPVPDSILSVKLGIRSIPDGVWSYHNVDWSQLATCNSSNVDASRIAPGPAAIGTFRVDLPVGTYQVSISNCNPLSSPVQPGCRGLPVPVNVLAGSYVKVDLSFDTGIR